MKKRFNGSPGEPDFLVDSKGGAEDPHKKRIKSSLEDARNAAGAKANRGSAEYYEALEIELKKWTNDDLIRLHETYRSFLTQSEGNLPLRVLMAHRRLHRRIDFGTAFNLRRNLDPDV
jgi:hypothetical protein